MKKNVGDFIGIPFKAGGRDYKGCDCYGLMRLALRDMFGFELPEKLTGPLPLGELWRELDIGTRELTANGTVRLTSPLLRPMYPLIVISRHEGIAVHCGLLFGQDILHVIEGKKGSFTEAMRCYRRRHSVQEFYEWPR